MKAAEKANNSLQKNQIASGRAIAWEYASRLLAWLIIIPLAWWSLTSLLLRDQDGNLSARIGIPLAAGAALLIIASVRRLKGLSFWLALATLGQAATLQIIDAGNRLHYQHYDLPGWGLVEAHPIAVVIIGFQAVAVLVGLGLYARPATRWLKSRLSFPKILVAIAIVFLPGAALSPNLDAFGRELVWVGFLQALNLGNLVLIAINISPDGVGQFRAWLTTIFGEKSTASGWIKSNQERLVWILALWSVVLTAVLSYFVYQAHPHVTDEVLYFFQARYLATGKLTVPAPNVPQAFAFYMIPANQEQWYSIFPPGWPAVLAVGMRLGIPWIINPLLTGLNILLAYRLARRIYSPRVGRMSVFLLALSPWFIFMGMSYMSHTLTLGLALAAALMVARARSSQRLWPAMIAGLFMGGMSLVRPQDAAVVMLLLGLWLVTRGGWRQRGTRLVSFIAGVTFMALWILPYNQAVTGNALAFPLASYYRDYIGPNANAFGFGPQRGLGWPLDAYPGHSPLEALINGWLNAASINTELFGWAVGSFILLAMFLLMGRFKTQDTAMLIAAGSVIIFYSFYWYSGGPDFGARYWYLTIIPLTLLSVRGIHALERLFQTQHRANIRIWGVVFLASLLSLVNFFPWRAVDKYYHYLGMQPDILSLAEANGFGRSLVLIQGENHPDYQSAWVYNPLDLSADEPLYAWEQDPDWRSQLAQAYPDRPVWVVQGPSITGQGYKVVEGPVWFTKERIP